MRDDTEVSLLLDDFIEYKNCNGVELPAAILMEHLHYEKYFVINVYYVRMNLLLLQKNTLNHIGQSIFSLLNNCIC